MMKVGSKEYAYLEGVVLSMTTHFTDVYFCTLDKFEHTKEGLILLFDFSIEKNPKRIYIYVTLTPTGVELITDYGVDQSMKIKTIVFFEKYYVNE